MRNLNIKIPGYRSRHVTRAPWVLRHCPKSQRGFAFRLFTFIGGIAYLILFFATFLFIVQTPLLVVAAHPDSPIAVAIRWLRAHFSHDSANFIYGLVSLSITFGLVYAIRIFHYIRDEASPKLKRDLV